MSSYTANIYCEKCGRLLTSVHAEHEVKEGWFVPQDIMSRDYKIDSIFCQKCLNGEKV